MFWSQFLFHQHSKWEYASITPAGQQRDRFYFTANAGGLVLSSSFKLHTALLGPTPNQLQQTQLLNLKQNEAQSTRAEPIHKGVNQHSKYITQGQQRPESPTVTHSPGMRVNTKYIKPTRGTLTMYQWWSLCTLACIYMSPWYNRYDHKTPISYLPFCIYMHARWKLPVMVDWA